MNLPVAVAVAFPAWVLLRERTRRNAARQLAARPDIAADPRAREVVAVLTNTSAALWAGAAGLIVGALAD